MPAETGKPKPSGKKAEPLTPDEQKQRLYDLCEGLPADLSEEKVKPKPPGKLGAEKLTPEEQKRRFIEAARAAGASEDEADFDAAVKRIAKAKAAT